MLPFLLVKWVHVLSAITAVGANFTYGIWIAQASVEPSHLPYVLRNIRLIDRRLANPSYGLLLVTGLMMAFLIPIPLDTPWLLAALILYAAAALLGIFAYSPVIKKQMRLLESAGLISVEYRDVAKQSRLYGMLVTIDVVLIVFLMVVKPPLW